VISGPLGDQDRESGQDDEGPVGPFPGWKALYWTVVVYGVVVIGILTLLTRVLSHGGQP